MRFEGATLAGRLRAEAAPDTFQVHGDIDAWTVTAKPGRWGGIERKPVFDVAHSFRQPPDSIILLLPDAVRLVCEFADGKKITSYLMRPGMPRHRVPFEAPELLLALTEAVRAETGSG